MTVVQLPKELAFVSCVQQSLKTSDIPQNHRPQELVIWVQR